MYPPPLLVGVSPSCWGLIVLRGHVSKGCALTGTAVVISTAATYPTLLPPPPHAPLVLPSDVRVAHIPHSGVPVTHIPHHIARAVGCRLWVVGIWVVAVAGPGHALAPHTIVTGTSVTSTASSRTARSSQGKLP